MEIKDFQEMIGRIYARRDEERGKEKTMLWVVEEVGELSQAVRRGDVKEVGEELADVFAWLVSLANLYNIDLESEVKKKYPGYCLRCGKAVCECETI
ncbi:nucleotide pyrophosphohydrolase [Archaeoglobales archaeon]|nr:MAG: nucleotide pyrophosphohydrolase [Archaeoglobales archaeon]